MKIKPRATLSYFSSRYLLIPKDVSNDIDVIGYLVTGLITGYNEDLIEQIKFKEPNLAEGDILFDRIQAWLGLEVTFKNVRNYLLHMTGWPEERLETAFRIGKALFVIFDEEKTLNKYFLTMKNAKSN